MLENRDKTAPFEPASGRLFLCLELPDVVKRPIARLRRLHRKQTGIAWIDLEKLHLTLHFLGPQPPDFQAELAAGLAGVRVDPFLIGLKSLGVFPGRGPPGVLWAGVHPVDPRLLQLHHKLEMLLMKLGLEPERRRFHPHVTIARCQRKAEQEVKKILLAAGRAFETAPFRVTGFSLFASQLTSQGSQYTRLQKIRFQPPEGGGFLDS